MSASARRKIVEQYQTIEQLQAKVAELEAEVKRLSAAHVKACQANADSQAELAAEQLNNKRLRDALSKCSEQLTRLGYSFNHADHALAIPHDTSALDTYVAEKVKEAGKFDVWKTNPYTKVLETSIEQLTKQRDLAVEALEAIAGRRIFSDNLAGSAGIAVMTLDIIKESEAK